MIATDACHSPKAAIVCAASAAVGAGHWRCWTEKHPQAGPVPMPNGLFDSILATVGNTPIVRLNALAPPGVHVFAKIEAF